MRKILIILTLIFAAITATCACANAESGIAINLASCSFSEWVNAKPENKPIDESAEKILLREQWEDGLGIDIFYPYFKAKELETAVKERTSVRVFKIKGKSEFKSNEAKYTFSIKF
jgi:hypothetical protein